ncbi:hypothetical protein F01_10012 [Burkholderia cenocepacia]|nr:hypothetical protein F01_10012 [Burkholderia cenocepacia]
MIGGVNRPRDGQGDSHDVLYGDDRSAHVPLRGPEDAAREGEPAAFRRPARRRRGGERGGARRREDRARGRAAEGVPERSGDPV